MPVLNPATRPANGSYSWKKKICQKNDGFCRLKHSESMMAVAHIFGNIMKCSLAQ